MKLMLDMDIISKQNSISGFVSVKFYNVSKH